VRVFLDECVDWRLARAIAGDDVKTARQMGWTTIDNGQLLTVAGHHLKTNRLADLEPLVPKLLAAIEAATIGAAKVIAP